MGIHGLCQDGIGGVGMRDSKRHRTRREWQSIDPTNMRILMALDAIDPHENMSSFRYILAKQLGKGNIKAGKRYG